MALFGTGASSGTSDSAGGKTVTGTVVLEVSMAMGSSTGSKTSVLVPF